MEGIPLNEMTIFEQWWQAIQPALEANTLNFWQNLYKEIYMNLIKDDRWLQYLKGLGITLQVSFYAILVGVALGTLLAILRLPQVQNVSARGKGFWANLGVAVVKLLSKFAGCYINLFRGTPLLLQVLIINFGIFGSVRIDKVIIGVIACGLNSAAYVAEIVRGGIMSVEKGQTEAGRSLGFSGVRTMLFIILPQAAKSEIKCFHGVTLPFRSGCDIQSSIHHAPYGAQHRPAWLQSTVYGAYPAGYTVDWGKTGYLS